MRNIVFLMLFVSLAGCATTPRQSPVAAQDQEQRDMLAMLLPDRVEVVAPFTRVGDFDETTGPDGVELFLRAVNSMGDTGMMLVGNVRVELFEFVQASADCKGRRLEHWNVDLRSPAQQRRHWNSLTRMYELRLGLRVTDLPPAERYVLYVTYQSPLGQKIDDEFVLEVGGTGARRLPSPMPS